jgi:hypothetical protein
MSFKSAAVTAMLLVLAVAFASTQEAPSTTKADELSAAARKGDAAAVKRLVDAGVDVNTKFRYDATALFYACDHGHLDVVRVLLDHGADVNIRDTFYGFTPLMLAVRPAQKKRPEHAEIARLLIARGAAGKEQALSAAVAEGDVATVKAVLQSGAVAPGVLTDALESARADARPDVAALLEGAGAKPYDDFALTPEQLARYAGTYRHANGTELVFALSGARLSGGPAGQRLTLVATSEARFRVIGAPNMAVSFETVDTRVISATVKQGANTTTYPRVEGK